MKNMRRFLYLCIIISVFTVSSPLIALKTDEETLLTFDDSANKPIISSAKSDENPDAVSVFSPADNTTVTVSEKEYIIGSVAAEMPASYSEEALKAQAVACHTLLEYKKNTDKSESVPEVEASSYFQNYLTKEEMKTRWGDKFDEYYSKIENAVESVSDKIITFENEPIMALYHAVSAGNTGSAEELWGSDIPYLQSVSSPSDRLYSSFSEEKIFSAEEFEKIIKESGDVSVKGKKEKYIGKTEYFDSGYVKSIVICKKEFTGEEIRKLFSLRSSAFTLEYRDSSFVFETSGYGHGVGMSQYGAECLAKQGFTYDEILRHYYTGVEIQ